MRRFIPLFIAVSLVLPGAAIAMPAPDRDAGTQAAAVRHAAAVGKYYASFAKPETPLIQPQAPATVVSERDGLSWTLAIGAGIALMLLAGGLGVYAGRMVRPRHIGA
jgi:hypothetical protein